MSIVQPPPARLIDEMGKPCFGVYYAPIQDLNLDDFDYRILGRLPFSFSEKWASLLKKRWQYFGAFDQKLVLGVAVIHLGYVGSAFAYVYERGSNKLKELNLMDIGARKTIYSDNSVSGFSSLGTSKGSIRLDNDVLSGPRKITVQSQGLKIDVELPDNSEEFTPLALCSRNGLRGFNYTHKAAGLPATGAVEVDGRKMELSEQALGVVDWTAGCAAHETYWNWASAAGMQKNGKVLGLNLVSGINETAYTENVIWFDGKPIKVDIMHFDYDYKDPMQPWKIRSNDGKVDLEFTPESERREDKNVLFIASKFRQPFGSFEGQVKIGGKKTQIDSLYGFVEEHFVRW